MEAMRDAGFSAGPRPSGCSLHSRIRIRGGQARLARWYGLSQGERNDIQSLRKSGMRWSNRQDLWYL